MSDSSSTNSWTFLTSEAKESGVESVGVLPQGDASSSGSAQIQSEQLGPGLPQGADLPDSQVEVTHSSEPPQIAPLGTGEGDADLHAATPKPDCVPTGSPPVENLSSLTSDPSELTPCNHGDRLPDPDSELFSDSFAATSPSPGLTPDPDALAPEGEELSHEDKKSELTRTLREEEAKPGFEAVKEKVNEGAGLRRRNISLLTPQHHRDDDDDEDVEEEPFRPSPREDGFGFSLNKCIFGALVLLGLGTIFFSAGDADVGELKDPEIQKEWLNPEATRDTLATVQHSEALERLAKDSEQISKLQSQLQQQEEQLQAAQVQVEEGSKERMRREELEAENRKMKEELDRLPALQKQLEEETQKRVSESAEKELQALPAMQKALEILRVRITELSQNTVSMVPSAEHEEVPGSFSPRLAQDKKKLKGQEKSESRNDPKKDRRGKAEAEKPQMEKDGKKKDRKKKGEWEKEKSHQEEDKELREKGEMKDVRGGTRAKGQDDGKRWKNDGEKRKFKQVGGKGQEKEHQKWKNEKHGTLDSRREKPKEKKGPEIKEQKSSERKHGHKQKDWKQGKEWKKVEQGSRNERKEQREGKKVWNESKEQEKAKERGGGGKDDRKPNKSQKDGKTGKGKKDHHQVNGEKVRKDPKDQKNPKEKHWSGREQFWSKDEGTETWNERREPKDEHQNGEKWSRRDKPGHGLSSEASPHSHSHKRYDKHHMHDDYWTRQRDRMRHYHGSTGGCTGVTECAHAEGLNPVAQRDLEALLLDYLSKVLGPEEQTSKMEQLHKLAGEFFTDGVFVHDEIPFAEFVEDLADILEDVAEDEGNEEMEDEMEGFAREAMEKFALPDRRGNGEKRKGVSG